MAVRLFAIEFLFHASLKGIDNSSLEFDTSLTHTVNVQREFEEIEVEGLHVFTNMLNEILDMVLAMDVLGEGFYIVKDLVLEIGIGFLLIGSRGVSYIGKSPVLPDQSIRLTMNGVAHVISIMVVGGKGRLPHRADIDFRSAPEFLGLLFR